MRAVRTAAGIGAVLWCRHGYSSAAVPDPARPKNAYVREDQILPHLAAIAILLAPPAGISGPESGGSAQVTGPADGAALIDRLRADGVVLTYDQPAMSNDARLFDVRAAPSRRWLLG